MRETSPPNRQAIRPRPRRRWLWALLVVLVVSVLLVAATPYLLRYGIEQWLYAHGARQVQIGDLRANPINGLIELSDLEVTGRNGQALRAAEVRGRFQWRGLGERQVLFESLALQEATLTLGPDSQWRFETAPESWPVVVQRLELADVALQWNGFPEPFRLRITEASLGPWSNQEAQPAELSLRGSVADAPLRLSGSATLRPGAFPQGSAHLEIDDLRLDALLPGSPVQGRLSVNLHLQSRAADRQWPSFTYEGTVRIESLQVTGEDATLQSAHLAWAGDGSLQSDRNGTRLQQQGRITMAQPRLQNPDGHYAVQDLIWHGHLTMDSRTGSSAAIRADGTLETDQFSFQANADAHAVHARRLQWRGVIGYGTLDVPGGLSAQGSAQAQDLKVTRAATPQLLLSARLAELRDLDLKGTYRMAAQTLQLSDYRAAAHPDGSSLMQGAQAVLEQVSLEDRRRFEAEHLQLRQAQLLLRKSADHGWFAMLPIGGIASPLATDAGSWRIGRVEVEGEDSVLRFEHSGLRPALTRTLQLHEFSLGELDSSRPQQPTSIALHGTDDHGARVVAVGKLMPFAERINLALKTKIHGIRLQPLSPYAARLLGYRTEAGVARFASDLHVIDDQLRSDNTLQIRGLRLQAAPRSRDSQDELNMPVPVAVALLQEADRDLHLSIPVRADLGQAGTPLENAIEQALDRALQEAAMDVARDLLHPFSPADTDAAGLQLEPLRFRAGSDQLNTVAQTYLRRVAALLRQRPALTLTVCGVAVDADGSASGTLAQHRAEAVVQTLGREFQVADGQLRQCTGSPGNAEGLPRAELTLQ